MTLHGSPSVSAISDAAQAFQALVDALAQHPVPLVVDARCRCDTCGALSGTVDLTDPDAAEAALRAAGWVRDAKAGTDTCPACANTPDPDPAVLAERAAPARGDQP